jgi:hypothetical protein
VVGTGVLRAVSTLCAVVLPGLYRVVSTGLLWGVSTLWDVALTFVSPSCRTRDGANAAAAAASTSVVALSVACSAASCGNAAAMRAVGARDQRT